MSATTASPACPLAGFRGGHGVELNDFYVKLQMERHGPVIKRVVKYSPHYLNLRIIGRHPSRTLEHLRRDRYSEICSYKVAMRVLGGNGGSSFTGITLDLGIFQTSRPGLGMNLFKRLVIKMCRMLYPSGLIMSLTQAYW